MFNKRRVLLLALCITLMCSLLVAVPLLLHSGDPVDQPFVPSGRDLPAAISNATEFLKGCHDYYVLLFIDVIYRRFDIEEFNFALPRYNQMMDEQPLEWSLLHLFRRIAVYNNPLREGDLTLVSSELDRITVPALYCNQMELPSNYSMILENEVNRGGYFLTHALLAWIWVQENGCELAVPDGFVENLYAANADLINNDANVTDLELEAAAFLCLAGQADLIDDAFADRVVDAQNADVDSPSNGSWGHENVQWHTTVLGLLFLLHVQFPADSYPPSLASAAQ
jgi:hypothetical protein